MENFIPTDNTQSHPESASDSPSIQRPGAKVAGEEALKAVQTEHKRLANEGTMVKMGLGDFSINEESINRRSVTQASEIPPIVATGNEIPKIVPRGDEIPKIKWGGTDSLPPITGHYEMPRIKTRPGEFQ